MGADATAERVRQLIKDSDLNQAEYARRAGLDAPKMSKSLSGARRFTSLELAQIAELSGVTVDWLLGTERRLPALAARASGGVSNTVEHAVQEARRFAQFRSDLLYLGYTQDVPELPQLPARSKWIDQGSFLAVKAIEHAQSRGVSPHKKRDIADAIEQAFDVDVAVSSLQDGFDGLAWSDDAAKLIVVGKSEVPARQRFTLAHELGHILAGDDQSLIIEANVFAATRGHSEVRANSFAASFLMPESIVSQCIGSKSITEKFFAELSVELSVSPSALAWRLHNLGVIEKRHHDVLKHMSMARAAELAGTMGDLAEWIAVSSRHRIPTGLIRSTLDAYAEGRATLRPFANLIGVDTATLRKGIDEAGEVVPSV